MFARVDPDLQWMVFILGPLLTGKLPGPGSPHPAHTALYLQRTLRLALSPHSSFGPGSRLAARSHAPAFTPATRRNRTSSGPGPRPLPDSEAATRTSFGSGPRPLPDSEAATRTSFGSGPRLLPDSEAAQIRLAATHSSLGSAPRLLPDSEAAPRLTLPVHYTP